MRASARLLIFSNEWKEEPGLSVRVHCARCYTNYVRSVGKQINSRTYTRSTKFSIDFKREPQASGTEQKDIYYKGPLRLLRPQCVVRGPATTILTSLTLHTTTLDIYTRYNSSCVYLHLTLHNIQRTPRPINDGLQQEFLPHAEQQSTHEATCLW